MIGPYLDAANVDLKAFRDGTYRKYVGAKLEPVLETLRWLKAYGTWLEVTTLVVPGINDDPAELRDTAAFVAGQPGVDTSWHISRFFPGYKMLGVPPTPVQTLQRARDIGREVGLRYIHIGNLAAEENTYCHGCGRLLIRRIGYRVIEQCVQADGDHFNCSGCGADIAGVGLA